MEYIGKHEKGAESVYDMMCEDLFSDKAKRTQKFMRTHAQIGGKFPSKDKTPADRKADKKRRRYRMYGAEEQWASFTFIPDDPQYARGGWCWSRNPEGKKNPINPEMDVIRNRKYADRERILREDFEMEMEDHEYAVALYNDFVGMAMYSERMAEIDMDLKADGLVENDLADAKECRKTAQEILREECY